MTLKSSFFNSLLGEPFEQDGFRVGDYITKRRGRRQLLHRQKFRWGDRPRRTMSQIACDAVNEYTRTRMREDSMTAIIFTPEPEPGTAGVAVHYHNGPNGALSVLIIPALSGQERFAVINNRRTVAMLDTIKTATVTLVSQARPFYQVSHGCYHSVGGWCVQLYNAHWLAVLLAHLVRRGYVIEDHGGSHAGISESRQSDRHP